VTTQGEDSNDAVKGKMLSKIRVYKDVPNEEVMECPSPIVALVEPAECNYCGQCATACIHDAIAFDKAAKLCRVDPEVCTGCGFCAGLCPQNTISIVSKADQRVVWAGRGGLDSDWVNWQ